MGSFPHDAFRVVAFADVLGWGEVTCGVDQLIARKVLRHESLSESDREAVDSFKVRIERARVIDHCVGQILSELRDFAIPDLNVTGEPEPKHFWSNRHVTFVRFSDNVFLHSTSFQWVVQFLSEFMKRGVEKGVLFRAGLSAGSVFHDEPTVSGLDSRSRDVSLYGDGITTAVAAERAGKGLGVRVLVHPRLQALLGDDLRAVVRPIGGCRGGVEQELLWWADLRSMWPDTSLYKRLPVRKNWPETARERLQSHPDFEWNRASVNGMRVVADTVKSLSAERSTDPTDGS